MEDTYIEIEYAIKEYFSALFNKDYQKTVDLFYVDDLKQYKMTIETIAKQMEYFGENRGLLRFLKLSSISDLFKMEDREFLIHMLSATEKEIADSEEERQQILNSISIKDIQHAEFISTVFFSMEIPALDETVTIDSDVELIKSDDKWKVLFKSGLDTMLDVFQGQINDFHERKKRDRIDLTNDEQYLDKFELVGWKNPQGQTVIEPRFAEAGDFNGDLAPARVMTYWGYINRQGEFVIQPQFSKAREFEEDFAAVEIETDEKLEWSYRKYWTFINEEGEIITGLQFDEVYDFTEEGLAAVRKNDKWGYLNTKGEMQIGLNFVQAESFLWDVAEVTIEKANGKLVEITINTKGEMIE